MGIAVLVYSILEVRYTYYMNHAAWMPESVYLISSIWTVLP